MKHDEFNEFKDIEIDKDIAKLLAEIDRIKTPEEIEKEKEEYRKEILSKGFLPINDELAETMSSPMEIVEQNPRRFIIEECVPACQELWKKNIYTFMVSDHLNEGVCWIEICFDNLSDENKEIFSKLEGEDIIKFSYHRGCVNIGVNCVGQKAQDRLLEISKQFQMQDVPYGEAYITLEEFLIRCGCYDEVANPNYEEMEEPWNKGLPLEELKECLVKYDEWKDSDRSEKTYRVFNREKLTKPLEEYFKDNDAIYDYDNNRVYLSKYHYQKHMNYINYLTQTKKKQK